MEMDSAATGPVAPSSTCESSAEGGDAVDHAAADRGSAGNSPNRLRTQGQTLRLAMALIEGAANGTTTTALDDFSARAGGSEATPVDDASLVARLQDLARSGDCRLAEQLRLLLRFDSLELWRAAGCRDCAQWMDRHLGVRREAALERLRTARLLEELPVIRAQFAVGALSYSQVKAMTRVADSGSDAELAAAVLDLSASDTIALCQRWHYREDPEDETAEQRESRLALQAFEERALHWRNVDEHTIRITLDLPRDSGAEFIAALECVEDELISLRDDNAQPERGDAPPVPTSRQRRADAAILLTRKAMAHVGEPLATADRYRTLLIVDSRHLSDDPDDVSPGDLPPERPIIQGYGPVSVATARRIAGVAPFSAIATDGDGQITGIASSARFVSAKLRRAVIARDGCCQVPGCSATRWLDVHHVQEWAKGGRSEPSNLAACCPACHHHLHEGGLRLERVVADNLALAPAADKLSLEEVQLGRARIRVARIQRFRLIGPDGQVMAGPRRGSETLL